MDDSTDDPRPVLRCIAAWWQQKKATPIMEPRGDTRDKDGTRNVQTAAIPLADAADLWALGYDIIKDPFDHEELTRWEQRQRSHQQPRKWYER